MVAFTAPWCQHSKALLPELVSAARALHERPGAVPGAVLFAQVDGTVDEELTQAQGVESFPTIKWFVDGEARDYKGVRNATAIARWVEKRIGAASDELASLEAATEWVSALDPRQLALVGFFAPEDATSLEGFHAVARLEDATQFAHVHDTATYAAVAELAGVPADALGQVSPPAVFLRKPWDELHAVAELGESARSWESRGGGGRSADELADEEKRFRNAVTELLVAHALPLVVPFSEEFQEAIFMQEVHAAQSAHMYTHTHTSVAGRA